MPDEQPQAPNHLRFALAVLGIIAILCAGARASNMGPVLSSDDEGNHHLADSKLSSNVLLGNARTIELPNVQNLIGGELASLVRLTARQSPRIKPGAISITHGFDSTALFVAITIIVGLRPGEEMAGITARRIVAFMESIEAVQLAFRNSERHTIRFYLLPIELEGAMPKMERSAHPRPALIRPAPIDEGPETSNVRIGQIKIGTRSVAHGPEDITGNYLTQ